jgi:hypothetical protein
MFEQPICIGIAALIGCALLFLFLRVKRLSDLANTRLKSLQELHQDALIRHYYTLERCAVTRIGVSASESWDRLVLLITEAEIGFYRISFRPREPFIFTPAQIRWFGRPQKYHVYGRNELWLHVERDGQWYLVKIKQYYTDTQDTVRALKSLLPHLVTPYRRQRPYIHYGTIEAREAEQAITGEWTLLEPVRLYLMPLYLVLMDRANVRRTLPLETVTHVASIDRLDAPGGVVRFRAAGEQIAFAVEDHHAFGEALAEAAKRSLEQPLEVYGRKGKKGKEDEEEYE